MRRLCDLNYFGPHSSPSRENHATATRLNLLCRLCFWLFPWSTPVRLSFESKESRVEFWQACRMAGYQSGWHRQHQGRGDGGGRGFYRHAQQLQQDREPTIALESTIYHEIKFSTSATKSRNLTVLYTASLRAADEWVKARLDENEGGDGILQWGIDTESRPRFIAGATNEGPVVLQLASASHALVFQLNACKDSLADSQILAPALYAVLSPDGDAASGKRVQLVGMGLRSDYCGLGPIFGWDSAPLPTPPSLHGGGMSRQEAVHHQALLRRTCTATIMGEACTHSSCTAAHILPAVSFAAIDAAKRRIEAQRAKRERRERGEPASTESKKPRHAHLRDLEPLKMGGLQSMAMAILGVEAWKTKKLQMSKWQLYPHTRPRVVYAAMDAWAAAGICAYYRGNPPFPSPPPREPKDEDDEEGEGEEVGTIEDQQKQRKRRKRRGESPEKAFKKIDETIL